MLFAEARAMNLDINGAFGPKEANFFISSRGDFVMLKIKMKMLRARFADVGNAKCEPTFIFGKIEDVATSKWPLMR